MKPIRLQKPSSTKFERMAANAKRLQAFRELVKAKGTLKGKKS